MKKLTSLLTFLTVTVLTAISQNITGTVYADGKPAEGVLISDGIEIVTTDSQGNYELESNKKSGTVFLITPSGYVANSKKGFQPDFWASLNPDKKIKETHNFNLISQQQDSFSIIFTTDSHLTDDPVKHDFTHYKEMVLPTARRIAAEREKSNKTIYSVNLGDLSHDLYWYKNETPIEKVVDFITAEGFPALTYSVPGNHDNDPAITGKNVDERAIGRYRKQLGPNTYSINIGNTHWIMLDDVIYRNRIGKGKVAKGVAGDRSYKCGLTKSQIRWIKKDLAYVPDTAKIIICCHIPMLIDRNPGTLLANVSQMDSIAQIFDRFKEVTIFSGHAHRNAYQENPQWNKFKQFILTATSGVMWQTTNNFQTIGADGSTSGLWVADFNSNDMTMNYYTYIAGDRLFRTYDLNTIGKYYAENPTVRYMIETYPRRIDYSDEKYKNIIYVNFWGDRSGRKVEILEDGKPLEVKRVRWEDPLYVLSYYVPEIEANRSYRKKFEGKSNSHAFVAKSESPTSKIVINVYEKDGTLLQNEVMNRTKVFDKNAE